MRQDTTNRSLTIQYLSKKQIAEVYGVSTRTIDRLLREGLGDAAGVIIGKQWRFDVSKAWEWFRQRGN